MYAYFHLVRVTNNRCLAIAAELHDRVTLAFVGVDRVAKRRVAAQPRNP